jgi:predicted permease
MLRQLFDFLFRRRRAEDDIDEELRSALEILTGQYIARGMAPAEARRAARIEFEGLEQVREKVRDRLFGAGLRAAVQDARYAWRGLWRRPSFAAVALVTLALGIGVNTAVFSVFYGVLLRPLPYDRPERLALVWARFKAAGHSRAPVSGAILGEIERRNRSLSGVAGIWTITRTLLGDNPEQVKCARVTANFFDVLGVRAGRGRTFAQDERGGPAILLTEGIFRRRYAADERLLGKGIPMLGATGAGTLTGVLPPDFELRFAPDANVPADVQMFDTFPNSIYAGRDQYYIRVLGRLKPGVSLAEAQRDLDRVAREIAAAYTEYGSEDLAFTVAGMQADAVRDVKPALTVLFAGSAFLLLICCVNVAGLLVARAGDRRREIALRLALGASRGRVLAQLVAEGAVLCAVGGAGGIAAGWAGYRGLLAIRPERLARLADSGLNWPVLALAAGCSLLAAMLFGLVPALESFRLDVMSTLRSGGRGLLGAIDRRLGGALAIAEIAVAFVLVTGAALTARTLARIERASPGFEPRQRLAFQVAGVLPGGLGGVRDLEAKLAAVPGVEAAGAISHLPLDTDLPNWYSPYRPQGFTESQSAGLVADLRCVTPGYFAAMGTRLVAGRFFDAQDRANSREVAIVDEMLARTTWPGESAIGKMMDAEHVTGNGFVPVPTVVVGVVEHIHNHSLTRAVRGQIYMPFEQSPRGPLTFVLRTSVPPLSLAPTVRQLLRERSRTAAMAKVRPMTDYVAREVAPAGFTAVLAGVFAAVALLLAATGIYGVLNYRVSRRLPEMGIRMAVGASTRDVLRLVLREGLGLAAAGVLLGSAGALLAGRWLGSLLFGVGPRDPLSYGLALLLLPAAALAGCWRPAVRAAAANPADMIREE